MTFFIWTKTYLVRPAPDLTYYPTAQPPIMPPLLTIQANFVLGEEARGQARTYLFSVTVLIVTTHAKLTLKQKQYG